MHFNTYVFGMSVHTIVGSGTTTFEVQGQTRGTSRSCSELRLIGHDSHRGSQERRSAALQKH